MTTVLFGFAAVSLFFLQSPPEFSLAGFEAKPDTVTLFVCDPMAISELFADIAGKVGPSVVTINSRTTVTSTAPGFGMTPWGFYGFGPPRAREFTRRGLGSGVIVTEDGFIVTNHHVAGEAHELEVVLSSGEVYPGILLADILPDTPAAPGTLHGFRNPNGAGGFRNWTGTGRSVLEYRIQKRCS